jgi:hypothetical protein
VISLAPVAAGKFFPGHFTGGYQGVETTLGKAASVGPHAFASRSAIGIVLTTIGQVIACAGDAHAGVDSSRFRSGEDGSSDGQNAQGDDPRNFGGDVHQLLLPAQERKPIPTIPERRRPKSAINLPWGTAEDELRHRLAASYGQVRSSLTKKAQAQLDPFE